MPMLRGEEGAKVVVSVSPKMRTIYEDEGANLPGVRLVHENETCKDHTTEETKVVHVLPVLLLSLLALGNLNLSKSGIEVIRNRSVLIWSVIGSSACL